MKQVTIKSILPIVLLLIFNSNSFSQNYKKNELNIFYAPLFSKTNFTNLTTFDSQWLNQLHASQVPNKGVLGYRIGVNYARYLFQNWIAGIGLEYSINGQQSPDFFSIKGISDSDLKSKPDYGGRAYRIKYKSYNLPIFIKYEFKRTSHPNIYYSISIGSIFSVYSRAEARNYSISKATGKRAPGCCESKYFTATGNLYQILNSHINNGLWRIGFLLNAGISYQIIPSLSIEASPEIRIYGKLKDTSAAHTVVEGKYYNLGLSINTTFHF